MTTPKHKPKPLLQKLGLDGFVLAIAAMVLLARVFPQPGLITQPMSLEDVATYGVAGIFFFYGLKLDFKQIKSGLANVRLHLLVQLATFILFPLVAWLLKPALSGTATVMLWMGIAFLCSLPSTVSSSVVMVSIAGGNLPAAIFNASISSLIGIFATPFWVGVLMQQEGAAFNITDVVWKLTLQVLLPVILGIALNRKWGAWATQHKNKLKQFDQGIILVIIYSSFCHSFYTGVFDAISWASLLGLSVGMLLLFFIVMYSIKYCCRLLGFSAADEVTAMFCGSKKSLVHGTVMSRVLFAGTGAGMLLLPLMIYHALQLIAASIMAQKIAARNAATIE